MSNKGVIIKDENLISNIRESGKYLTELLNILYDSVKPGITLSEIENISKKFFDKNWVKAAFKGYQGFPWYVCLSVNDCVVHGIPDKYELKEGDLLKIDAGVIYNWGVTDSAVSVIAGWDDKNEIGKDLIKATKQGIDNSLQNIAPWKVMFSFSNSIYNFMKNSWFNVIKNLTGHGVGKYVHEAPHIFNRPYSETKKFSFKENMVVAIEPITAEFSDSVIEKPGIPWNLFTSQGDLWAQREYTILINSNWYEILSGVV